jgi:hypothetical protein
MSLDRTRSVRSGIATLTLSMVLITLLGTTGCGLAGSANSRGSSGGNPGPAGQPAPSSQLSASSSSVSFGNVTIGAPSAQQVTLVDIGTADVTISSVSVTGNGFSASGGSDVTLTPNQMVTVSVTFAPSAAGNAQGSLSIGSNASNSVLTVPLSGVGMAVPAVQHSVALNWQPSASAVIGYFVYRGGSANGLSKLIASASPSTSYTDNSVANGQTYYYAVTSVDSSNVESAQSTPISVTIPNQ